MAPVMEMQYFCNRLDSFERTHQIAKRRTSATKKAAKQTVEWPHNTPTGFDLSRAGFYYRPAQDSTDNVQCFLCDVKLDGWEPTDNPVDEHIGHSSACAWAKTISVTRHEGEEPEIRDPLSEEMLDARRATFAVGSGWPHESKRGWKPKSERMAAAGWAFDPAPDGEDGVICFYCGSTLDGWEPKDDPWEEHHRRAANCPFFNLAEEHSNTRSTASSKTKTKKGKGRGRTSSASRQSAMSQNSVHFSDTLSINGIESDAPATEDSIVTTSSTTSKPGGKTKKNAKSKAAPRRTKSKKTASASEENATTVEYPDLTSKLTAKDSENEEYQTGIAHNEPPKIPAKSTRRVGARSSKQAESSVIDDSSAAELLGKKTTRGHKANAQPELDPNDADISLQLQRELEHSLMSDAPFADVEAESTPETKISQQKPTANRGIKRTSDGTKKETPLDSSTVTLEFPMPPKPTAKNAVGRTTKGVRNSPGEQEHSMSLSLQLDDTIPQNALAEQKDQEPKAGKSKRGRPKKVSRASSELEDRSVSTNSHTLSAATKPKKAGSKTKKATATKKKGKSSSASVAETSVSNEGFKSEDDEQVEDLERDEREIEAELERIVAEQQALQHREKQDVLEVQDENVAEDEAMHDEAPDEEFEPSPSRRESKHSRRDSNSSWQEAETSTPKASVQSQAQTSNTTFKATPSPAGSDKENVPSSIVAPQTAVRAAPFLSPTKTFRVPLAPGTPNRSPSRIPILSPSKQQFAALKSAQPWESVDLDAVLLMSSSREPSPGKVGNALSEAAGTITSPERKMSVEEWIRWRAGRCEDEMRRRCEGLVGVLEREGNRALGCLEGVAVQN